MMFARARTARETKNNLHLHTSPVQRGFRRIRAPKCLHRSFTPSPRGPTGIPVGGDGHPGGDGDGDCEGWVKAFPPTGGPPVPRNAFIQRVAGRDVKVKETF